MIFLAIFTSLLLLLTVSGKSHFCVLYQQKGVRSIWERTPFLQIDF